MTLRLLTLGVGDAFSARHYSTSFAVEADGRWLLVDCPHPMRKMLREASTKAGLELDLDAIDGVAVTHLHADHSSGLESFGYFNRFALRRRATLLAHPLVASRLWEHHLAAGMDQLKPSAEADPDSMTFADYFEHRALDETQEVTFGPFAISCRRTIHHVPTTALRIRAGARSIAYSADTTFDPGLIEWLGRSDLVIHETGYGIHTPYAKLAALPPAVRAKMRLIHYPDEHVPEPEILPALEEGTLLEI